MPATAGLVRKSKSNLLQKLERASRMPSRIDMLKDMEKDAGDRLGGMAEDDRTGTSIHLSHTCLQANL
jgi:hypothetical protein